MSGLYFWIGIVLCAACAVGATVGGIMVKNNWGWWNPRPASTLTQSPTQQTTISGDSNTTYQAGGNITILEKPTNPTTLIEPRFSENVSTVMFSLGERGMTVGYTKESLEKSHMNNGFVLDNYRPVDLYIEDNQLYADVKIYGGKGLPPIEIKKNKLSNKPQDWDFNSNENAMEIVNSNQIPVYQFFYKTPSHIVMNGIFPYPSGFIMANENGAFGRRELPTAFNVKRIFKYPSWKYPGKYEE